MPSDPASSGSLMLSPAGDGLLRHFRWIADGAPPPAADLRRLGWALLTGPGEAAETCPGLLNDIRLARTIESREVRAATLLIGIEDSEERADWLAQGFGDALSARLSLDEIEMRAIRVRRMITALPRHRRHGPLLLDLLTRDGLINERRIGLHPREFSLLWRLAETPGRPVAPDDLLAEVWRMTFRPETNSLAVHVCRLRAKLAAAGLGGIVGTSPDGAYFLTPDRDGPDPLLRRLAMEGGTMQAGSALRRRITET